MNNKISQRSQNYLLDFETFCIDQFANLVLLFDDRQPGNSEQKGMAFEGLHL